MKLFIAGIFDALILNKHSYDLFMESNFNLQTFFSIKGKETVIDNYIKYRGQQSFLLDSGAFSMFSGSAKKLSYDFIKSYVDKYCDYVVRYNIDNFIEMDIDRIIGYGNVKKMRNYIKNKTNKKPIEVWHPWRGMDDFVRCCKENDWICVSIANKTGKQKVFQYFVDEAYKLGTKVHILGYTPLYLEQFNNLYSCDSTSWSGGGRFSSVYHFKNNKLIQTKKPEGTMRNEDTDTYLSLNYHNLQQWIKYQKFLKNKGWVV